MSPDPPGGAQKHFGKQSYFGVDPPLVIKSSENPPLLGHLQNHHKFLSNHVICIEEKLMSSPKLKGKACLFVSSIPLLTKNMIQTVHSDASCSIT